ncbi:hypothetical protein AB0436_07995 [Streptomyces sp. NPDC051322]|uniref:hypothetical protein n=1 Tax=Streptomyces sp. NPDC051322 TaxID=3154645 RepID=UPI00344F6423
MGLHTLTRQLPLRIPLGAFFLNSGLSKRGADRPTAEGLHGFACTAYPFLKKLDAQPFVRLLSAGEILLGAALLVPVVPAAVAGAGVSAFSLGTMGLYLRVPGVREEGSLRPTQEGLPLAKDVWMLGIGLSLMLDDLIERCRHRLLMSGS